MTAAPYGDGVGAGMEGATTTGVARMGDTSLVQVTEFAQVVE
jgi:hypothetical protein